MRTEAMRETHHIWPLIHHWCVTGGMTRCILFQCDKKYVRKLPIYTVIAGGLKLYIAKMR